MLLQDFFPGWQESLKAKQSAYETTRPGKEVGKTVDQGNPILGGRDLTRALQSSPLQS